MSLHLLGEPRQVRVLEFLDDPFLWFKQRGVILKPPSERAAELVGIRMGDIVQAELFTGETRDQCYLFSEAARALDRLGLAVSDLTFKDDWKYAVGHHLTRLGRKALAYLGFRSAHPSPNGVGREA